MKNTTKNNELKLIPKVEEYIQYMLDIMLKLPRVEKFSLGTEYKSSMYKMLRSILYLNKVILSERIYYCNLIDSELNCQRIYLRIMEKNKWVSKEKFLIAMEKIYELGKILGGLIKYYAKNNTK